MEQTHIDIGSNKLGYRKVGAGPDLVFIHGWPLHRETWRNVAAELRSFTCHLIDLPGSGASVTPASEKVSLEGHVDAIVKAVDALGLDRFVLVGNDSGGMIARFAAEKLGPRPSSGADRPTAVSCSAAGFPSGDQGVDQQQTSRPIQQSLGWMLLES